MYILQDYDDTIEKILKTGFRTSNRTGMDTLTLFGVQTRYRIDELFPIPTKREYKTRSVLAEMLWMVSGSTSILYLEKMGSKIWSAWKDFEFEKINNYNEGEIGPGYGWQMRHFGEDYSNRNLNPKGFDQIDYLIKELRKNKTSRRILMNLWNPVDMTSSRVRLPACHYSFQCVVDNNDNLTGILSMRSCDTPIGQVSDTIFYCALLYMLAQQANLKPYEFIINMGNAHIYVDQIPAVEEYLSREKVDSPKLILNKANDIFSYTLNDFSVIDYNPLPKIKIPVAV